MSFSIDFEVLKNQANKKAVQADASPENNEIDNLERKISNQLNSTEHKTRSWLTTGFIFWFVFINYTFRCVCSYS